MNVKKEISDHSEEDTIVIKQKITFDAPFINVPTEIVDYVKNQQIYSLLTVNVKEEPRKTPDKVLCLNSFHVSEAQHSEVKPSDVFCTTNDLNFFKQEVPESKYIFPKVEVLTEYCDLPTLKSEIDYLNIPSTSDYTQSPLEQPKLKKKGIKRYPCPICQKNYKSSRRKRLHLKGHFGKRWLACEFCGQFFACSFEYYIHYFNHFVKINTGASDKSYKCNIQKSNINDYTTSQTTENPFKCEVCSRQFTRRFEFNQHFKIHNGKKPFKCEICSKQFARKCVLNEHVRVHTGEKPFKCEICLKQFRVNQNFKKHIVHCEKKQPFKCKICSKQYTLKTYLNQHEKIHIYGKQFKCNICRKQFVFESKLNLHMKMHINPYKCEISYKYFTQKSSVDDHIKIHAGEKPFKCEICLKQFQRKFDLNQHFKIHTGEKPYKCKICLKQFTLKCYLKKHLKIHDKPHAKKNQKTDIKNI